MEKGWNCAEAVELSSWMQIFADQQEDFWETGRRATHEVLKGMTELQFAVVHRRSVDGRGMIVLLSNAVMLAEMLQEHQWRDNLWKLRSEVARMCSWMAMEMRTINIRKQEELQEIQEQRATLDKRQVALEAKVHRQLEKCRSEASSKAIKAMQGLR